MTWCPLHLLQSILRGFLNKVPNSAGKIFFSSFKLLSASCTYSEQLCHRAKRIDVSEKKVPMFEDENLDDLDIGFPSPTAPSSPGTRASSLEVPEARGKGKRKTLESVAVDYHFRYLVLYLDLEWFESIIDNCHFLEFSILDAFPRSSCQPLEI